MLYAWRVQRARTLDRDGVEMLAPEAGRDDDDD
jgi:hypothetical protein